MDGGLSQKDCFSRAPSLSLTVCLNQLILRKIMHLKNVASAFWDPSQLILAIVVRGGQTVPQKDPVSALVSAIQSVKQAIFSAAQIQCRVNITCLLYRAVVKTTT